MNRNSRQDTTAGTEPDTTPDATTGTGWYLPANPTVRPDGTSRKNKVFHSLYAHASHEEDRAVSGEKTTCLFLRDAGPLHLRYVSQEEQVLEGQNGDGSPEEQGMRGKRVLKELLRKPAGVPLTKPPATPNDISTQPHGMKRADH